MDKRGQLTIFIIIGLLVVIVVGIIIFLNAERARPIAALPQVQEVAEDARPVQDFIHNCLTITGQQGLQQMGDRGGYLDLRDVPDIKTNPVNPTESDALMLSPTSQFGIPYWWYMKSENTCTGNCEFSSKRPNLYKRQGSPSMEGMLERYIDANIETCLKNFDVFRQQGVDVTADDTKDVEVFVTSDKVIVGLLQDYTVTTSAGTNRMDEFAADIDVRLLDIYNLATNITVLEAENAFLAKHVKNIIGAFSRIDSNALPPVGSTEFETGGGEFWAKITVQQRLQELLQSYVPLFQVFGTRNYRPIETPAGTQNPDTIGNALNRDTVIPQLVAFPDIEVNFAYIEAWKLYFDLNCEGAVCKSENLLSTFGFVFGIQRYSFAYDVSYPVLVELRQPDAFNGAGYTFRFALEGNLRNNEPVTADWEALNFPQLDTGASQLCHENQKTSGFVNITIEDSLTRDPVEAAITYSCGPEACIIGKTLDGQLSTRLPRCLGGQLSARQNDYAPVGINLNSNTDDDQIVDWVMHPIVEMDINAIKYRLKKDLVSRSWRLDSTPVFFTQFDQAIVVLNRKQNAGEESFATFGAVCGTPFTTRGQELDKDMKITAGNYTVQITSLYHENITVPPDLRCYDTGGGAFGFGGDDEECFFVPEKPIFFGNATGNPCTSEKPFISGSIEYDWEVTPDMLRNNKIIFPTLTVAAELLEPDTSGGPGTYLIVEDLELITQTQNYATANPNLMVPEVRR